MLSKSFQVNPAARGYHAVYREQQVNNCPGCGRTHWFVGRLMAECAFCATALPLAEAGESTGMPTILKGRQSASAWETALAA